MEIAKIQLRTLRSALDEVPLGVVLLDAELRAQFINRAFRKMWRLPDDKADGKPAFVALMYHGRDIRAYDVPEEGLDSYIAERVAYVKAGGRKPIDIRLTSGEVLRFQCTPLPAGGRMLSYTYVTDIVRHADELGVLRAALNEVEQGVILLDENLNARFMNRAVRKLWHVLDEQADTNPPYHRLVNAARITGAYGVSDDNLEEYIAKRIDHIRAGDSLPFDLHHGDGRTIRSHCTVLPNGGRLLTYSDITDLVRQAEELKKLATIDGLTELYNRRHFHVLAGAEWSRFQRYHRPLSLVAIDIDHFKSINDRFGHDMGDRVLAWIGEVCKQCGRATDVFGRVGGDEFVALLPETDLGQAGVVADRLRSSLQQNPLISGANEVDITISIGIATATLSMAGYHVLLKQADQALYQAKESGRNRTQFALLPTECDLPLAAE